MKYAFERFVMDTSEYRLTRDGQQISMRPKPFDVLALLVSQPGRLLSRDELSKAVWKGVTVEQASLHSAVAAVRQALGERAELIETVPGRGYRWLGQVHECEDDATVPARPVPSTDCSVVIVDDHDIVRLGVRAMLDGIPHCHVIGDAAKIRDAAAIIATQQPDLLILDLLMDGVSTLPHIAAFREASSRLRVIVLSMHEEGQWARQALAAGARGYVMKSEVLTELTSAIEAVRTGGIWVSASVSRSIVQDVLDGKPVSE